MNVIPLLTLLFTNIVTIKSSCPDEHCLSIPITTLVPVNSCCHLPSKNPFKTRSATIINGETYISFLGPENLSDAAPIVIAAAHGGYLKPDSIPDRQTTGPYCPSKGCKTLKDANTLEIARAIADAIARKFCKVPFLIINHLHRSKLDANREIGEAAQSNPTAEKAWWDFHDFISEAQGLVVRQFGAVSGETGREGARGLFLDVHGYAGTDWVQGDGSPFVQWGYRFSKDSLDPNTYCPLDNRSHTGTHGSLTHARFMPKQSYECLVRGPNSLAGRLSPLLSQMPSTSQLCGEGLPGPKLVSPKDIGQSCKYCMDACPPMRKSCNYFSGGYNIEYHEHLGWRDKSGLLFNAVQAELPRCVRFGDALVWREFADALSVAIYSFLYDIYGNVIVSSHIT